MNSCITYILENTPHLNNHMLSISLLCLCGRVLVGFMHVLRYSSLNWNNHTIIIGPVNQPYRIRENLSHAPNNDNTITGKAQQNGIRVFFGYDTIDNVYSTCIKSVMIPLNKEITKCTPVDTTLTLEAINLGNLPKFFSHTELLMTSNAH